MIQWDAKNLTELTPNDSNNNVPDRNDITNEIKTDSSKNKCNDTGNELVRRCPKCGDCITYNRRCNYLKAVRKNCKCKSCSMHEVALARELPSKDARRNMSMAQRGRKHSETTRSKMRGEHNGMF